jgi:hypothetical protein
MQNSRIISFSYKPGDKDAQTEIDFLKKHCVKNSLNFSALVIKAIINLNKELKEDVQRTR